MRKLILLLTVAFILKSAPALALDEIIKNYRGIRSLGMGGVVTTTGIYDEALFGNPATMLEVPESKLTFLGLTVEGNTNLIGGDIGKIRDVQNASGSEVLTRISDKGLLGRNEHARATLLVPAYYNPKLFGENTGFAFGLLLNTQANIMLRGDASIDSQTYQDIGPNFSVAHKLLDGNLNLGLNLHTIYRVSIDRNLRATEFLGGNKLSLNSLGTQGFGIDTDLGAYYKLPFAVPFFKKLSVGTSLNNVFESKYSTAMRTLISKIGSPANKNIRTLNVGVRGDLPDFWLMTNTVAAIEMQDIGEHVVTVSTWKRLHLGAETHFLSDLLAVRLGLNQGYLGGGLGLNLPIVKVDFAAYGEEIGPTTGQLEDIRMALRLSFDI